MSGSFLELTFPIRLYSSPLQSKGSEVITPEFKGRGIPFICFRPRSGQNITDFGGCAQAVEVSMRSGCGSKVFSHCCEQGGPRRRDNEMGLLVTWSALPLYSGN
jgi:hypothetical protein